MNKNFVFAFVCSCIMSCTINKKTKTSNQTQKEPRTYIAYYTNQKLTIDGKANESSWNKVPWTDDFIDIEGVKKPKYRTRIKMMWDDTHFYFFTQLKEPHIWADITKRDAVIFYNNDFEIFIDPDGDTHNYYEFEINALNTVWDLFLTKPYRDNGMVINNWDYKNIKTAVQIDGTINDPSDIDKEWTIEIAIPWKSINETYDNKIISPKGLTWRINFSRVNWHYTIKNGKYARKRSKNGKYLPEYNWVWSPQGVINMHEPEKWGYVYFSSKIVGADDSFIIPDDERIKWKLFEYYKKQKKYHKTHQKWATALDLLSKKSVLIKGNVITPILENHSQGYNITVKSPFSKNLIIIREDGKLIIKN